MRFINVRGMRSPVWIWAILISILTTATAALPDTSGNVGGCGKTASEAASSEKMATDAYARGHYQVGVLAYQQAADLYHDCSDKASDVKARQLAFYDYLSDLAFAAQHASDRAALYQRLQQDASEFLRKWPNADVAADVTALKSDPAHPRKLAGGTPSAAVNQTTASTAPAGFAMPVASSAPLAINKVGCSNGLTLFSVAYESWRGAMNRYVKSTQNTQAAIPQYPASSISYVGGAVYAGYELEAIRSVISAEEPKLIAAQTAIAQSGAQALARTTLDILQNVRTRDAMDLAWTQSRYSALITLESGGQASLAAYYPSDRAQAIGQSIDADWTAIQGEKDCAK